MAQFKDLFTELRRDTGLSQEDFAALFHQSGSTIAPIELDSFLSLIATQTPVM